MKEGKRRGGYNAGLKMEEGTRTKESTQRLEAEKGKETQSTQNLQKRMEHCQHLNFSSMRPKFRFLTFVLFKPLSLG